MKKLLEDIKQRMVSTQTAVRYIDEESVHKALHGWTTDSMNRVFTRKSTRRMKRDDGIREYLLVYQVHLVDDSARRHYDNYPVTEENLRIKLVLLILRGHCNSEAGITPVVKKFQ